MASITILGAGVTGMTIASQLPADYKITILGDILPGDPLNKEWASPWAGACWVGQHISSHEDQKLQLDALAVLWKLAEAYPESGLRISKMTEIFEYGSPKDIWYRSKVPEFRLLEKSEMPSAAKFGMTYKTVCISPPVFLSWMRSRLEARGVRFERAKVESLADLKDCGHDVLVNASGAGAMGLKDVAEADMIPYRLQSIIVNMDYDECYIYRGQNGYYFNMFGRGDGTTYIGGVKQLGSNDRSVYDTERQGILSRGHKLLPSILPSADPKFYDIAYDIGNIYYFRPLDKGGCRVEKDTIGGQKVIHSYGQEAGGYCFSFGLSRKVAGLVSDYLSEYPIVPKL